MFPALLAWSVKCNANVINVAEVVSAFATFSQQVVWYLFPTFHVADLLRFSFAKVENLLRNLPFALMSTGSNFASHFYASENNVLNEKMVKQVLKPEKPKKILGADESRKKLLLLVNQQFDPDMLNGIVLDKREVGRIVAETVRPLRIAAISAGLNELKWLLENTFYEAYGIAQAHRQVPVNMGVAKDDVH